MSEWCSIILQFEMYFLNVVIMCVMWVVVYYFGVKKLGMIVLKLMEKIRLVNLVMYYVDKLMQLFCRVVIFVLVWFMYWGVMRGENFFLKFERQVSWFFFLLLFMQVIWLFVVVISQFCSGWNFFRLFVVEFLYCVDLLLSIFCQVCWCWCRCWNMVLIIFLIIFVCLELVVVLSCFFSMCQRLMRFLL